MKKLNWTISDCANPKISSTTVTISYENLAEALRFSHFQIALKTLGEFSGILRIQQCERASMKISQTVSFLKTEILS